MIPSWRRLEPRPHRNNRIEMEWEEALLRAWDESPPQPTAYFRRKAAHARRVAEEVTTRAVKTRLLDEAIHYDRLAAHADRARKKLQFSRRHIERRASSPPAARRIRTRGKAILQIQVRSGRWRKPDSNSWSRVTPARTRGAFAGASWLRIGWILCRTGGPTIAHEPNARARAARGRLLPRCGFL